MDLLEAIEAAQSGKKITRPQWKGYGTPFYVTLTRTYSGYFAADERLSQYRFSIDDIFATDWKIYKDSKKHSFSEAVKWLLDQRRVRRRKWREHFYIFMIDHGVVEDSNFNDFKFTVDDFTANDWECLDVGIGEK